MPKPSLLVAATALATLILCGSAFAGSLHCRSVNGNVSCAGAGGTSCQTVDGKTVYQVGVPIHWGFVGIAADNDPNKGANWIANALTPFVGDANARTPEFKAFLVNVEKM